MERKEGGGEGEGGGKGEGGRRVDREGGRTYFFFGIAAGEEMMDDFGS